MRRFILFTLIILLLVPLGALAEKGDPAPQTTSNPERVQYCDFIAEISSYGVAMGSPMQAEDIAWWRLKREAEAIKGDTILITSYYVEGHYAGFRGEAYWCGK